MLNTEKSIWSHKFNHLVWHDEDRRHLSYGNIKQETSLLATELHTSNRPPKVKDGEKNISNQ